MKKYLYIALSIVFIITILGACQQSKNEDDVNISTSSIPPNNTPEVEEMDFEPVPGANIAGQVPQSVEYQKLSSLEEVQTEKISIPGGEKFYRHIFKSNIKKPFAAVMYANDDSFDEKGYFVYVDNGRGEVVTENKNIYTEGKYDYGFLGGRNAKKSDYAIKVSCSRERDENGNYIFCVYGNIKAKSPQNGLLLYNILIDNKCVATCETGYMVEGKCVLEYDGLVTGKRV